MERKHTRHSTVDETDLEAALQVSTERKQNQLIPTDDNDALVKGPSKPNAELQDTATKEQRGRSRSRGPPRSRSCEPGSAHDTQTKVDINSDPSSNSDAPPPRVPPPHQRARGAMGRLHSDEEGGKKAKNAFKVQSPLT